MKVIFALVLMVTLTMVSCGKGKTTNDTATETTTTDTVTTQISDSPYFGWFKGKTEFSFKTVSNVDAKMGNLKITSVTTGLYYTKNGMEALKETIKSNMGGMTIPDKTLIYITSKDANYVIDPEAKKYFTEAGDMQAVNYSKVWQFTRKSTDSYEGISTNSSAKKETKKINGLDAECYTVQGVLFAFDSDHKLLQYSADLSGTKVVINFSDYSDKNVDESVFKMIDEIKKDGWQKVNSPSEFK